MADQTVRSLQGVRVLALPDPKLALCCKLLADMGADVVAVELPEGSALRSAPPLAGGDGESLLFWYGYSRARSVECDLASTEGRDRFVALAVKADVLLDALPPGRLEALGISPEVLAAANPGLIHLSATDFGSDGPFSEFKGSDIVAWAMGGLMGLTGDPAREPLTAPALQAYHCTSVWAAISVLGAVYRRRKTGQGARIDLSSQETSFDMSETAHSFYFCNGEIVKRINGDHPLATPFKVYQAKDGHVFVGLSSQQQWQAMIEWMRRVGYDPGPLDDDAFAELVYRRANRDLINERVGGFARLVTEEELFVGGAERGIPNAPVRPPGKTVEDDQLQFRSSFDALADPRPGHEGERHTMPCLPFRGDAGLQPPDPGSPPRPGEHTAEVEGDWSERSEWPAPTEDARRMPLEGVRVVDFCWNIAGPVMGRALGDLGAEIVKVEPREIGDPSRMLVPFRDGEINLNGSYTFHDINRDKQSVTIDMKKPGAAAVALDVIEHADVVLENFTGGTMGRLGADYAAVSKANPKAIMASLTGFGQTGPRASWPSYHPTSSALSGLTWLFGYEGGGPLGFGHSHMDYMAGYLGALGVLDGLLRREVTGKGDHVDVSQLECGATLVGPEVLQWTVNGETARPAGNRAGALGAPLQGCYQCAGDDQWIVVTATDGEMLAKAADLTGAGDGSVETVEAALAAWCAPLDPWDAFYRLQTAGVAAGVVSHGPDLERDEHLAARGAVARVPHPELDEAVIVQCPIILDGERLAVHRPCAVLGEHNEPILRGVVGMSEEAYLDLVVREII